MVKKKCCNKVEKKGHCCSSCPLFDEPEKKKKKKSKRKNKKKKRKLRNSISFFHKLFAPVHHVPGLFLSNGPEGILKRDFRGMAWFFCYIYII